MSLVLRLAAVNHQDGGINQRPGGSPSLDRLDAQLDLLTTLEPDVVFSTEGKGWLDEENHVLRYAAHRLKMTPLLARAPRHDCNLVIWLRPGRFRDIVEHHETHAPFWHGQGRATVRLDGLDEPLRLFAAHYSPFVPQIRAAEAYATVDQAADGRLAIGGGDFQDDAHSDPIPDRSHMDPARRQRYSLPSDPDSPAAVFERAGMIDLAAALGHREPTAGFVDGAPLRCDRFHLSRRLAHTPCAYRAHPDPDGTLSDHLIIDAELDLTATA